MSFTKQFTQRNGLQQICGHPIVSGMGAIRWGTRGTRTPSFSDSGDKICHVLPHYYV